jgi:hypothetical protein
LDTQEILLVIALALASLPFGGPVLVLAAIALLDVPTGFQGTATKVPSIGKAQPPPLSRREQQAARSYYYE